MAPVPTPAQLRWQEAGLSLFLHFGINTFTGREWGSGKESPEQFFPTGLDARQWAATARDFGFHLIILTAKHHDGFCLWPTQQTGHSVQNSPWKDGKGDVVGALAEACAEFGLEFGFYLSPWDRHEPSYGNSPAYNAFFRRQLRELCTRYGPIAQVWFDGACGEGPNGRRQEYDWQSYYAVVRELQPEALISICGPDVRWVGNENGVADETNWSVQEPHPIFHAGRNEPVWWPAECDVSIRPGWFWHPEQDTQVKSLGHLLEIYYCSVGRNAVLLLNVPPNREGHLPDPDLERLYAWKAALDETFQTDYAANSPAFDPEGGSATQPQALTDDHPDTFWVPARKPGSLRWKSDSGSRSGSVGRCSRSTLRRVSTSGRIDWRRSLGRRGTFWSREPRSVIGNWTDLQTLPPIACGCAYWRATDRHGSVDWGCFGLDAPRKQRSPSTMPPTPEKKRMVYRMIALKNGECQVAGHHVFRGGNPAERCRFPLTVWLIEGGERPILVDAGLAQVDQMNAGAAHVLAEPIVQRPEERIEAQLARRGYSPADVVAVVITHLHFDHVDQLPLYEHATYYVSARGLRAATRFPGWRGSWAPHQTLELLTHTAADRTVAVDDAEVLPGIRVRWIGGHTACSQCVEVETRIGPILLVGDAIFRRENLTRNCPIGIADDPNQAQRAVELLRNYSGPIFPSHDPIVYTAYGGVIA